MTTRQLVAALFVLTASVACGGGGGAGAPAPGKPCRELPTRDPAASMLEGVPTIGDVLYGSSAQGKTRIVFELVTRGDFVAVRDELVDKLEAAGWTVDGTDQELVEAEAQFSRPKPLVTGSVKVEPFCEGHVRVRYRLSE